LTFLYTGPSYSLSYFYASSFDPPLVALKGNHPSTLPIGLNRTLPPLVLLSQCPIPSPTYFTVKMEAASPTKHWYPIISPHGITTQEAT